MASTLADYFSRQLLHLLSLRAQNLADKELAIHAETVFGIDCLLGIVDEILQQERQYGGVGVALILLTDGRTGALLVVLCHQALPVAQFGKQLSCFVAAAYLQQCSCVDILHHVAIHRFDVVAGRLFPEAYVLVVTAQQHVASHEEQCVLTAQTRLQLALCVGSDAEQFLLALCYLLFGGVVPLFARHLVAALQIAL